MRRDELESCAESVRSLTDRLHAVISRSGVEVSLKSLDAWRDRAVEAMETALADDDPEVDDMKPQE